MKTLNTSFYIISFSLFLGIAAPQLFSDGMFMDGLLYAAIAHNLALGFGSFWDLNFSPTFIPHFFGHPPLQIWLQAGLFKLFGDSIYIERFYSFFSFLINGFLILKLWQTIVEEKYKKIGYLVLLLWLIIPLTTWAVANNILENTMQIFSLLSVLFIFKSRKKSFILYSVFAGVFLFFGFLSKGFVTFFPLVLPLFLFIFYKNFPFRKFILSTFILIFVIALSSFLLALLAPESVHYFMEYFKEQIIASLHLKSGYKGRFFILSEFFNQILPTLVLVLLIFIISKIKKKSINIDKSYLKLVYVFGLLVLSGILPFLLSLKQRAFYLLPILPYISILAALLILPLVNNFLIKKSGNAKFVLSLKIIAYTLLAASLIISLFQFGRIGREKDKISDVYIISKHLPTQSVLKVNLRLRKDYSLMGYFARYGYIGLENTDIIKTPYFLTLKKAAKPNPSYLPVDLKLKKYTLYKKNGL